MTRMKSGDRFGSLTLISGTDKRQHGYVVWSCRCDCGKEIDVPSYQLVRGIITSCGCTPSEGHNSLVGQRFGKLLVVEDLGTQDRQRRAYRCVCDCGNECIVTRDHLSSGGTRSCGCLRIEECRNNLQIVEGTSLSKIEKRRNMTQTNNTSGYTGVYPHASHGKKTGRWSAQIGFKGKRYYLGSYEKMEEAVEARKAAETHFFDGFLEWYYKENKVGVALRIKDPELTVRIP